MKATKILLVDDDELVSGTLAAILEQQGFEVTLASGVPEALKLISSSQSYEVLLTDLHMPGAGDGLTVVSAMRHANPKAITILLSAFPEMNAAARAILQQTDEILVKPMDVTALAGVIRKRLAGGAPIPSEVESVATILERSIESTIHSWFARVEKEKKVMIIPMSREARTRYLPKLLKDLVARLRSPLPLGSDELISDAAHAHGALRRQQGYSTEMVVEESRMLQVSIFETLQNNRTNIDYSVLLDSVMVVADEVDSQLGQQMKSYNDNAIQAGLPH